MLIQGLTCIQCESRNSVGGVVCGVWHQVAVKMQKKECMFVEGMGGTLLAKSISSQTDACAFQLFQMEGDPAFPYLAWKKAKETDGGKKKSSYKMNKFNIQQL